MKNIDKKKLVIILSVVVLLTATAISYAYFTSSVIGNDTAKNTNVTTGTMSLELDGTTIVSPTEAMFPGASHTLKFSVTNTGTVAAPYGIDLINVTNSFVDKNDLVYSISSTNAGGTKTTTVMPSDDTTLIPAITIEPGVTQEYTMTIHFKETGDDQNDNQGKTFGGLIQINNLKNSKYLASKVVTANPIITSIYEEDNMLLQSGVVAIQDDQGTSYINRDRVGDKTGSPASNYTNELSGTYVSFANRLWRIVRVNGDGSIRIITDESVGNSAFNTTPRHQYVGYTYNNSHNCTNANPCNGSEGTASTMKTYLDNWYNTNLKSYEDEIATGDYCNDTSYTISGDYRYYGARTRLYNNHNQTLNCPNTSVNYGGKYNLKIGLLSADEIALAGIARDTQNQARKNYLYKNYWWWSFSPDGSSANSAHVFLANDYLNSNVTSYGGGVRPVINLKADTLITSGNGTASNPYVV